MSQNDSSTSNNDDNAAFLRQYAAEIARLLREQEESTATTHTPISTEESTMALYRALCFDEPLLDNVPNLTTAASALCRQLTSAESSRYAISNRLVNGIVYLCRQRSNITPKVPDPTTTTTDGATTTSTSTDANLNSTTAIALAKLAFCVLIQVPLECCQHVSSTNLPAMQRYLGSYKGVTTVLTPRTESEMNEHKDSVNNDKTDQMVNQLVESLTSEAVLTETNGRGIETASLEEEVWAAESDPSDYDYGEGDAMDSLPQQSQIVNDDDDYSLLDPMILSQADPHLTLDDARDAIGSLLQQANYMILAPIFQLSKKQVEDIISQLTQLLLLLLQPPQSILLSSHKDENHESSSSSPMQDAMLAPLWILRDAALHHPTQEFFTKSFLEVLQTLLAVDQAYLSDLQQRETSKQHSTPPLCSASIVGLSALSSWCCSAGISTLLTSTAILDATNDLAHVMERAAQTGYRQNLQHSITPIIEVLTGITFRNRTSTGSLLGTMVPQTLLNSGLLRQLLVLSLETDAAAATTPPYYLDHALWGLCVVYPSVIGKYVSRYPGFPKVVRRYHRPDASTGTSRDCVHSILWNCFAILHCQDVSQAEAPRVVWKTKAPAAVVANGASAPVLPLTRDECREVCQKSWVHLCGLIQSSLDTTSSESSPKQALEAVQDWERLLILVGIPSVVSTFQTLIDEHDTQLQAIRACLSQSANENNDSIEHDRNKDEKLDDEDGDDRKKSSMSTHQLAVATARKTLKQYTLFFQGNARSSSKTD